MSYESRDVVCRYLCYHVSRHGFVWEEGEEEGGEGEGEAAGSPAPGVPPPPAPPPAPAARDKLHRVLREVGDRFERQYRREFADIAQQMRFQPEGARGRFDAVAEELFRDGINWGRIVAFLVFGGTLCVDSCRRGGPQPGDSCRRGDPQPGDSCRRRDPQPGDSCRRRDPQPGVGCIAGWMVSYLDSSLATWISANGDWDAFVELYGNNVHRFFDIPLPHLWTALAFAAVVTCVTIAYLAHQY